MTTLLFLVAATAFLSYANGANDNFKGVASLYGSRTLGYRPALAWATVTTLTGSVASMLLAHGLLSRFSGKGLVPSPLTTQPEFLLAVALGAGATVLLATLLGFPISTTHGLMGGLVGAGLAAAAGPVHFDVLGAQFLLPLLLAPLAAIALSGLLYGLLRSARRITGLGDTRCLCIGETPPPAVPTHGVTATASLDHPRVEVAVGELRQCASHYPGSFLGISTGSFVDALHFLSAGAVCFARGLNDTPKLVALLLVVEALELRWGFLLVAVAMAAGGWLNARRVAETMGHKITEITPGQGFAANLATALLVAAASAFAWPASTTHVSVGALFGIGLVNGGVHWRPVLGIALSWLITLPCAATCAAATYLALR